MTNVTRTLAVAALAALTAGAHAISGLDSKKDSDYVDFGKTFTSVGKLSGKDSFGSGTLIASEWVLTAAHVIKEDAGTVADFKFTINGAEFLADKIVFHDALPWDKDKKGEGRDIALVKLKKAVTGVTPSKLYSGKWDAKTLHGTEGAFAGFGFFGNGKTGAMSDPDGTRRAATNAIDAIDLKDPRNNEFVVKNTFMLDFDDGQEANNTMAPFEALGGNKSTKTPTTLEGATAPGDSGGGFFIKVGDEWQVAGVAESSNGSVYGKIPFFTALRDHNDWVVKTVPEPGSMLALGVGVAALVARRRRP